ncbi:hypothetical protein [Actinoallomurus soli]|uniref:hypothetical protein n=1 Tax=Actinoallomurus soli TaxID=2952535 RepID=UPI00209324EB|nr:hypothetical protein [Actinoallomurus soli]MCO5970761.1 hypothetical protein [Actinoallomurus soli]
MHELLNGLIVVAIVVFVIARRFTARRVDESRFLVLPLIAAVIGLTRGSPLDAHHEALSAGLLAGEILAALLLGLGLGATMRVWRAPDGALWSRGTWATFGVFLLSVAVRGGMAAVGYAAGVRTGSGAVLLSVAAWMLTQNAVLMWRARAIPARVSVVP